MEYTTNKQKREKWLGREILLTADGWASWFSIMFNVQDRLRDLGEDDISEANRKSLPPNIKLFWVKRREWKYKIRTGKITTPGHKIPKSDFLLYCPSTFI